MVIIFISYIISEKVTDQNKESGDFQEVQAGLVDSLLKENDEILDVQKQVEGFIKFLENEYETVKKLEEENS